MSPTGGPSVSSFMREVIYIHTKDIEDVPAEQSDTLRNAKRQEGRKTVIENASMKTFSSRKVRTKQVHLSAG